MTTRWVWTAPSPLRFRVSASPDPRVAGGPEPSGDVAALKLQEIYGTVVAEGGLAW